MTVQMLCYIAVMAGTTYLIRALPMLLVRKKIKNRFVQSFLYYVPYAVLAAMTVPAILESTASAVSATAGLLVAVLLSYLGAGLLPVALAACGAVFCVEWLLGIWR